MTVHALAGAYRRGRVEASRRWVIHGVLPKWYMRNRTGQFAYRGRHRLLCLVSSGGAGLLSHSAGFAPPQGAETPSGTDSRVISSRQGVRQGAVRQRKTTIEEAKRR